MQIMAKRVVVIGTSCAGKTTFSRALSKLLDLPHFELDELHWGPNWTPYPDFRQRVERAVAEERWVTEGNYSTVRELTWGRAELVIWLDYEMGVVVKRALKRTIYRAWTKEPMWAGNRESWRLSFFNRNSILLWVLMTWRKRRHSFKRLFAPNGAYRDKPYIRLRTPEEAQQLLDSIAQRRRALSGCP